MRKQQNGLDLSGIGKSRSKVTGGGINSHEGLHVEGSVDRARRANSNAHRSANKGGSSYIGGYEEGGVSKKTVAIVVVIVVCALALAIGVGVLVYQQTVKNALKSSVNSEVLSGILVSPEEEDSAYWSVLVKTDAESAEVGRGTATDIALVYFDPENLSASFLWLPSELRVYVDGYGYRTVAEAFSLQGDVGLVNVTSKLADIDIAHYIEFNDAGLARFESDLVLSESETSTSDREQLAKILCKKIFGSSSEQLVNVGSFLDACAATDMDASAATAMFGDLQGMNVDTNMYQVDVPTQVEQKDGVEHLVVTTDTWPTMIKRVESGLAPEASEKELSENAAVRSGTTVEIWNGVGVSGVANDCKGELEKIGWSIGECGNAAQFVYSETLIVYNTDEDREIADLLVSDLGQGRAVRSAARYSFKGDVLIVIGKDYQPY